MIDCGIIRGSDIIDNKYILILGSRFPIRYQISDDYYTEVYCYGLTFKNMFLCGKMCGIKFK